MTGANVAIPGVVDATEIGRGGFGVVYRATETDLGREVAVKVLTGELDERTRTRFERERRAMGALSSHPNIITIFRSGVAEDAGLYLVMEYLPGGSLAEQISQSGPTAWQDTLRIGVELCGALESAHRAGVLHRDVKPGNIIMDSLGRAKLGDFGIARLDGSPETKSAVITASVAHAPPEVIAGEKPDERSDVYSLASTLFEVASGSPAFVRPTDESMIPMFARIVHEPTPDLRQNGVPDAMASVLERGMAKRADQRFRSAGEFGAALIDVQRRLGLAETRLWIDGEALNEPEPAGNEATQIVAPPASGGTAPGSPTGDRPPPPGPGPGNLAPPGSGTPAPHGPGPQQQSYPPGPPQQPPQQQRPYPQGPGQQQPPPAQLPPPAQQPPPAQHQHYPVPQQQQAPGGPSVVNYGPPQGPGAAPGYTTGPTGPVPTSGSKKGLLAAIGVGCVALLGGFGLWAVTNGDDDDPQPLAVSGQDDQTGSDQSGDDGSSSDDAGDDSSSSGQDSTTTTTTTTTTEPSTTTTTIAVSERLPVLADLPSLPAVAEPYVDYRTLVATDGAFTFQVPTAWEDDLVSEGEVLASPNNEIALADGLISGAIVSGIQGIGVFDAELFLNNLIVELDDPENPCDELKRVPYVDGPFDGLLYAESCAGGDMIQVWVLVSNPSRDAVIFVGIQMTDERDFAAFEEILDSFLLINPELLPAAS